MTTKTGVHHQDAIFTPLTSGPSNSSGGQQRLLPAQLPLANARGLEDWLYDILIAAEEPQIENAAHDLIQYGIDVRGYLDGYRDT